MNSTTGTRLDRFQMIMTELKMTSKVSIEVTSRFPAREEGYPDREVNSTYRCNRKRRLSILAFNF